MSILQVLLCVLFLGSLSLSAQGAGQPNCTGVGDFEACRGNTDGFCPSNISCQCKNEEPFCRCDYFRVGWKEYWYMGPKCNRLWNTLHFILVATLPAVALIIIVVAIFSNIYFCKSEKARNQAKPAFSEAQHNPAFAADTAANLRHPQPLRDARVGQIPKPVLRRQDFNDASIPDPRQNYSPVYPQPLRAPGPAAEHFSQPRAQREEFDYPGQNLPHAGYGQGRQYWKY